MAKKLKVGDTIRGYRVTKVLGPGAMAISYGAVSSSGQKIFLKQYKSPAPTVVWYPQFVAYQHELARRVRSGKATTYAVHSVEAFEERWGGTTYFQAYEFVEDGADLQKILEEEAETHRRTGVSPTADPDIWARHVTWAKVLMAGVAALHESNVVHADLKPANVYLIRDPSIAAGYQLKLIDMDFSLLADRRAPWHGFQGYVGTDNYRSPEHMTKGAAPSPASDVFTAGLILYEMLAGVHPYWQDDQAEYARLVRAHAAKPATLRGVMPGPATNAEVGAALHQCLSPDPTARPTGPELRAILSGRGSASAVAPAASTGSPATRSAGVTGRSPLTAPRIALTGPESGRLEIGVRTEFGKYLARQFGADAEVVAERQFVIERTAAGWVITPAAGTPNETLLNGEIVAAPQPLAAGDVIAVGRKAKGITRLPLTVREA